MMPITSWPYRSYKVHQFEKQQLCWHWSCSVCYSCMWENSTFHFNAAGKIQKCCWYYQISNPANHQHLDNFHSCIELSPECAHLCGKTLSSVMCFGGWWKTLEWKVSMMVHIWNHGGDQKKGWWAAGINGNAAGQTQLKHQSLQFLFRGHCHTDKKYMHASGNGDRALIQIHNIYGILEKIPSFPANLPKNKHDKKEHGPSLISVTHKLSDYHLHHINGSDWPLLLQAMDYISSWWRNTGSFNTAGEATALEAHLNAEIMLSSKHHHQNR